MSERQLDLCGKWEIKFGQYLDGGNRRETVAAFAISRTIGSSFMGVEEKPASSARTVMLTAETHEVVTGRWFWPDGSIGGTVGLVVRDTNHITGWQIMFVGRLAGGTFVMNRQPPSQAEAVEGVIEDIVPRQTQL